MADLAELDRLGNPLHSGSDIIEQLSFLVRRDQAEQSARLTVIVIAGPVVIAVGGAGDRQRRFFEPQVFDRPAKAVGLLI
jgi:hypothetical protein